MLAGFSEVLAGGHGAVVILGGVNNIDGDAGVRSDLGAMYSQAQQAGLRVVAVTVLPYKGYSTWTAARGAKVRAVNDWIRQQGVSVADGFQAMGDPSDPDSLRPGESRDRLHPNDAGYQRLGPVVAQALRSAR
jgi:lysophospholipase L1-like esterase